MQLGLNREESWYWTKFPFRGEVLVDDLQKYEVDIACLTESHMAGNGGPVRFVGSGGTRQMYFHGAIGDECWRSWSCVDRQS